MIELWQTEWCPSSHRVRQRLSELGLDCVIHQVPVDQQDRTVLHEAVGALTIPALTVAGEAIVGEEEILGWLDRHYTEPQGAAEHRAKAEKAMRKLVEEQRRIDGQSLVEEQRRIDGQSLVEERGLVEGRSMVEEQVLIEGQRPIDERLQKEPV